jgi:hypothetical protein
MFNMFSDRKSAYPGAAVGGGKLTTLSYSENILFPHRCLEIFLSARKQSWHVKTRRVSTCQ